MSFNTSNVYGKKRTTLPLFYTIKVNYILTDENTNALAPGSLDLIIFNVPTTAVIFVE